MSGSTNLMDLAKLVLNQPTSIYTIIVNLFKIYLLYQEASILKELIGFIHRTNKKLATNKQNFHKFV